MLTLYKHQDAFDYYTILCLRCLYRSLRSSSKLLRSLWHSSAADDLKTSVQGPSHRLCAMAEFDFLLHEQALPCLRCVYRALRSSSTLQRSIWNPSALPDLENSDNGQTHRLYTTPESVLILREQA